MYGMGNEVGYESIKRRVRACDYLTVAQLFLRSNFLLERPLTTDDLKPRLLGHWGTCHGINYVYANLQAAFGKNPGYQFVLGPGHGFPALQANLFVDGALAEVDPRAVPTAAGIAHLCRSFSWPGGYPSHASPMTPGVICEGGELGYALATAYGAALGRRKALVAVLIGDGELETATALASLNLNKLLASAANGAVLPILHLNGYKISAPTIYGRKSDHELSEMIRGFGFEPIHIKDEHPATFQAALRKCVARFNQIDDYSTYAEDVSAEPQPAPRPPFLIFHSPKGETGPTYLGAEKIAGNFRAHQIPLPDVATDPSELKILETWLASYHFEELFNEEKGFVL